MNGRDITLTVLILVIFLFLFLAPILSVGIQNIRNNWVKYRCNPMVMPFSGLFGEDPGTTFTYCIQSMIKDFIHMLIFPLQESVKILSLNGGVFMNDLNGVRKMLSSIRSFFTNIIQSIFGVFLNILIEFQKIILNLKDLMGKMMGIMTTMLFLVYGSMQAMQSAWKGPPGEIARALCFDPSTPIRLYDGSLREISKLKLGDILKDGSTVDGILQLKNITSTPFYKFHNGGEDGTDILVTGSHLIQDPDNKWIPVSNHPDSKIQSTISPIVYSLMTSKQRIPIGKYTFWDWNDDEMIKAKN